MNIAPFFRLGVLFLLGTLSGLAASSTTPGENHKAPKTAPGGVPYLRDYRLGDHPPAIQKKVIEVEQRYLIADPMAPIKAAMWLEYPRPFSLEVRRGKKEVYITVLVLIDARGRTRDRIVLDATDEEVAKWAGDTLRHVQYKPATVQGDPVPVAQIFTFTGAGVPNE